MLTNLADNTQTSSLAHRLRRKRHELFESLLQSLARPLTILDVGGTQKFREMLGIAERSELYEGVSITPINLKRIPVSHPAISGVVGDARDLSRYADGEFDIVFSNSVIEHVDGFEDQRQMANEVQRVGQNYFVQTPNRGFPLEPHFLFPFFQFLPLSARAWLVTNFSLGWYARIPDWRLALNLVRSIRLLTKNELRMLFPNATIYEERILGMNKSFVAYSSW